MPRRPHIFLNNEIYHLINRGANKQVVFFDDHDRDHFIDLISYLSYLGPKPSYSTLARLTEASRLSWLNRVSEQELMIKIICYTLLPNHIHLVAQQITDEGLQKFAHDLFDSYTKYINTRHQRTGPLFGGRFRSVHIETDDQLLQVCRYTHLNPYNHHVVSTLIELKSYTWSNLKVFLSEKTWGSIPKMISHRFESPQAYWKFLADRADYQRQLDDLKHLLLE